MSVLNTISEHLDILYRPADLLGQLQALPLIASIVLVAVGAACVYNGYRWHKWIVVVLALMLGFGLGHMLSQEVGKSTVIAIALGVLFAAIATPMLRFTVAFFAGIAGAAIGATLWTFLNREQPGLAWAGAGMGFIALALMSFLFFRVVVILFTSVSGGAMLIMGGIAALLHTGSTQGAVTEQLLMHPAIMPLLILMAAVIGVVVQQGRAHREQEADSEAEE
jgi:hypothetical protein